MNPEPTVSISWDYLIELSDDGTQPDQPEPEVIILPPTSESTTASPAPARGPEQES